MSLFTTNDKLRKHLPVFKYITRYCPKALREMTAVSVVNNVRYNPDREPSDINWARDKSKDQLGSGLRHMMEHAVDCKVFEEVPLDIQEKTGITRIYILAENAWRAVAALELEIERVEAEEAGMAERAAVGEDDLGLGIRGAPIAAQEAIEELRDPIGCTDTGSVVEIQGRYGTTVAPVGHIPSVRC
jgi:hypothetical protein